MASKKKFAIIDCETDPFKFGRIPKPFVWGFYDGNKFQHFEKTKDLMNFLTDKRLTILAHNGGKFDFHFLLDYIEPLEDLLIINGRLTKFNIGNNDFRDSYSILPIPLKDFKKDDFNYELMEESERYKKHNWKKIIDYLKNDCVYLYELVNDFYEEYGKNITLASSAMKTFKKIQKVKIENSGPHFFETFKPYYYGGRCQVFSNGLVNEPCQLIDINSAYPFAMMHDHAWGKEYEITNSNKIVEQDFYTIDCISHGALPVRTKQGLQFPNDDEIRTYHITGWELKAGIETNSIFNLKILKRISFFEKINFKPYVNKFWALKNESKKGSSNYIFAKLKLNSLYGKFASNPNSYHSYMTCPSDMIEFMEENMGYSFVQELEKYSIVRRKLDEDEKRYYNLATGASITGFTRAYLWRAINAIQNISDKHDENKVIYTDTDSIIFRGRLPATSGIKFNNELGGWELENEFEFGGVAGKKLYAFKIKGENKYKTASKGVRLNHDQILSLAKDPESVIEYEYDVPVFNINKEPFFISRKITNTKGKGKK